MAVGILIGKIRLWNKRIGVWGGENPHDKVILKRGTKVFHLKGDLLHRAYRNSSETIEKVQRYSDIFARENSGRKSSSVGKILWRASFAFFKSYIIKQGYLDGFEGLMISVAVSNHVFYKYAKLYEINHREALGKRVVISRTDNLGDVILTLPLLGYLKSEIPELKIFFIGKNTRSLLLTNAFSWISFLIKMKLSRIHNCFLLPGRTVLFLYIRTELLRLLQETPAYPPCGHVSPMVQLVVLQLRCRLQSSAIKSS